MKKCLSIFILLYFVFSHCYSQETEPKFEQPINVSFEELIHYPKRFDKKFISVSGFLKFDKQNGNKIFFSKEDLENTNTKNFI